HTPAQSAACAPSIRVWPGSVLRRPCGLGGGPLREWTLWRELGRFSSRGSRPLNEVWRGTCLVVMYLLWCTRVLFPNYNTGARSREHNGGLHAGHVAPHVPLGCFGQ